MVEHLTKQTFLDKVFNYEQNQEWKFEGQLPCIIDFYADWCGPCRMVAPVMEEMVKTFGEKVIIGKVDVDANAAVAGKYGVMSIPTVILFNHGEEVVRQVGFGGKEIYEEMINKAIK